MEARDFETLETTVRRRVMEALTLTRGNQRRAAALLGVTRWKLARTIVRFGLREFVIRMRNLENAAEAAPETATSGEHASLGTRGGQP